MFPVIGLEAATGLGSAAVQGITGLIDTFKGRKKQKQAEQLLAENPYDIPSAKRAALGVAQRQASGTQLPAADLYRAQMGQATASGVGQAKSAATSASDVLGVLSSLYGNQQAMEQSLAIQGAERYDANQAQLQRALGLFGDEQAKKWDITTLQPYNQRMAQAEAYATRGRQGLSAALSGIGSTVGGMLTEQGAQSRFNTYMDYSTGGTQSQPVASVKGMEQNWMANNPAPSLRTELLPFNSWLQNQRELNR